jgi:hypothetical protein
VARAGTGVRASERQVSADKKVCRVIFIGGDGPWDDSLFDKDLGEKSLARLAYV